jgi:predicted ATPase/DNA-binding winged helix-turn-helix (wHTH) protein
MGYRFGAFEVDFRLFELRQDGAPVRIDRKVFNLLRYLLEHRERVVDKNELLQEVWDGEVVVDAVVTTAIARLRKVLGQRGGEGGPIQTVHGRGYRFIPEVVLVPSSAPSAVRASEPRLPAVAVPAQPVQTYVDTDLHPGLRDPFVGREDPMQRLHGALTKALAGTVRARLLAGEPGMGKSRLCQEISARARESGARVWVGRCYEADRGDPLWPWMQILRQAVDRAAIEALSVLPPSQIAELTAFVPELGSGRTPGAADGGAPIRMSLFEAITAFLRAASQHVPVVLVLDDLHWSDAASLQLFGYLLDNIGAARLLLLATFRDAELEPGHAHAAELDRLERSASCKRIAVGALGVDDVTRYLHEMTGQEPSPELCVRLYELTGGNPFFLRETVRSLTFDALKAGHTRLGEIRLPESARDVVRRRIALLPEASRRVLRAASVLGPRFDVAGLGPMLQVETAELLAALDRALGARLVAREDRVGQYAFAHALIRDTLYEDLPTTERCEWHLAAGHSLERQRVLRPGTTAEIALHFHSALPHGDGSQVFDYGIKAAQQAAASGDHDQEVLWYTRAYEGLSFAPEADVERSAQVMLALGRAHRASGRPVAAREALDRVLELTTLSGASETWAKAAKQELERLE